MLRFSGKTAAATLLAAATALTLTACSGSSSHPAATSTSAPTATSSSPSSAATSTSTATATATTSTSTATSAPAGASQITISNFAFSPADLSVTPGQTVTVVNKDSTAHTLTATNGKAFDTGDIAPAATATFTAPMTAGTYSYICTIHQFMHGTLTVK